MPLLALCESQQFKDNVMSGLEIYFVNDKFIQLWGPSCNFMKKSWEKIQFEDSYYYLSETKIYEAAIDQLVWRSVSYNGNKTNAFKNMIIHATGQFIDCDRGDGFTLMMSDLSAWEELLVNYIIPEEYKE